MCITSADAILKATIIGIWDIDHPIHGYRHVMAYQNAPQNLTDGPNSMILAIPTHQELQAEHLLNTENDVNFLRGMADQVAKLEVFSRGTLIEYQVVEMGVYHIAILNTVSKENVDKCMELIPEAKRPEISAELFNFYKDTYTGFPLLICCFSNQDAQEASPIMVHFAPAYPDTFMYSTVDAHGEVPNLGKPIEFHQRIIVGSHRISEAFGDFQAFDHSEVSPHLLPYLPKFGQGQHVFDMIPNYDILMDNRSLGESDTIQINLGILGKDVEI